MVMDSHTAKDADTAAAPASSALRLDWVAHYASATPHQRATHDIASGRTRTYAELHNRVGRLASVLSALGVGAGDRVGVLSLNDTDIIDIIWATWRQSAVHLALNFRLTASELAYIVGDACPHVVFYDPTFSGVIDELRSHVNVEHWIPLGHGDPESIFERHVADQHPSQKVSAGSLHELALLMYSSGTTGKPKGVKLDHENIFSCAAFTASAANAHAQAVNYCALPLFHIAAFAVFTMPMMFAGATNVVDRTFDPARMLDIISDPAFGVTHAAAVPAMWTAMQYAPRAQALPNRSGAPTAGDAEPADFSRLQTAISGAAPVPIPLLQWWWDRGVTIQEGFGMTETTGVACVVAKSVLPDDFGSAGQPIMCTQLKVMATDQREAAPGEHGELWLKGANITKGYWNRPDADETAFRDGWFRSGDVARIAADGQIYIEDRIKDMYISGGENVYPAEVESVLSGMPQIIEVAVVGIPDPKWGETGCVIAAIQPGQSLTLDDVLQFCDGKLATYKLPRRVIIRDALPRNASGKVLKFQLRADGEVRGDAPEA